MPRNGSGVYIPPVGTDAVSGTTIESVPFNTLRADIAADLNLPRPISAGGTAATTAAGARTNLDVQQANANLSAEAGLTGAANRISYYTGVGTKDLAVFTSAARDLLAAGTPTGQRIALELGDLAVEDQVTTALFAPAALRLGSEGLATPLDTEVPTVLAMTNGLGTKAEKGAYITGGGLSGLTVSTITGIPSASFRFTVALFSVSMDSSANFILQLGTSAAWVTTGYVSASGTASATDGFVMFNNAAASAASGHMTLTKFAATDTWISSHSIGLSGTTSTTGGGQVNAGAAITRMRISPVSGTFDGGNWTLFYETI